MSNAGRTRSEGIKASRRRATIRYLAARSARVNVCLPLPASQ